ncbi:CopD family protein [Pseudomonas sp. R3-56]|uniref:CopD family protein n=1 Tax=Pseudomonas sp. R3-56 TaxID=2817401 RepID=UPI003DA9EBF0
MMYLALKSMHIFFVLLWISGLVMQSLVLLAGRKLAGAASPQELARLRLLHKWDRILTTPAMVLAFGSGVTIAATASWFGSGWLFAKMGLALLLAGVHGAQAGKLRRMVSIEGKGAIQNGSNALPVILTALPMIVFLVIFKPF